MKQEITKPEAKRKLLDIITQEGVNTPSHLERSLKPPLVFADIANTWEAKRLPELKESSRYTAPRLLAKYMRPFFGQMAPEQINTGASTIGSLTYGARAWSRKRFTTCGRCSER
jgi:hypothetical protein